MSRRPLLTFALASLLGIIVVSTLMIAFIGSVTRRDLHQEFHARNELLAKSMTSSLERDGLVQILETPEELSGSTLAEHPLIRSFDALVAGYINGLPILHVRFYNTHSRVVYSTNKDVIGDDGSRDVHLSTAMRGRGTSRLIRRSSFNPIGVHGIVSNRDVYLSHMPIEDSDGSLLGVLEIHSEATLLLAEQDRLERSVAIGVIAIATLFYGILVLLYRYSQLAVAVESEQRENAINALEVAKAELEERVAERTQELTASHALLESILNGIKDPILIIDSEFRTTLLNDAARALAEDDPANASERLCYQITHGRDTPCSTDDHQCPLQAVMSGSDYCKTVHRHFLANGEARIVEVAATPLRDGDGQVIGIVEVEHDITDLMVTSAKLEDSEQRFRDLTDASREFAWELDADDHFTFVSDRVRDVLGYEPHEVLGKTPATFMPPGEAERVRKYFSERGGGKAFSNLEHRSVRKDGRLIWESVSSVPISNAEGELIGARGVCQDITERKAAVAGLRRSEEHLHSVMDNVEDAIITFTSDGMIESVNRSAEQMFGCDAKALTDMKLSRLIVSSLEQENEPFWPEQTRGGDEAALTGSGHRECEGVRLDGSRFPMDLWVGKMHLGGDVHFLAVARDATEAKKAEADLAQARNQFYHQEKIAAIGQLAAGILHEVGNPIAAMSGAIEEIRSLNEESSEAPESRAWTEDSLQNLSIIEEQIKRLGGIAREVAEFASPRTRDRELVDMNELIRTTTKLMRYDLRLRHVELRENLDRSLPAIVARADQLQQILMNLLINATDASEGVPDRKPEIEVRTSFGEGFVHMIVEDNCGGMEPDVLAHCGDVFFTTKEPGKGTGLGLPLCDSMARVHGGSLEIESAPGVGTMVHVYLPVGEAALA